MRSRLAFVWMIAVWCGACSSREEEERPVPIEERPVPMCPAMPAAGMSGQTAAVTAHVVDGRFTGEEWAHALVLPGVLTNVYLDYQGGYLYLLNDWRVNEEGVRDDCFNQFRLN